MGANAAIDRIDHVAIQVPDMESAIGLFTTLLGMHVKRTGTRHATGGRLALLGDEHGMKLELVQESSPSLALLHLAYRVEDVRLAYEAMLQAGCTSVRTPLWLDSAQADFATVRHESGLEIQLVRYAPGSPDL
jgi:catechol 2,3-dioxygenase-like lactoylglutathione lyase family enzyme